MALFLDIDGTLIEFHRRPDEIVLDPALRTLLLTAHARLDGALALISGRTLHGIDSVIGLPRIAAAGLHGAELRRAGHAALQLYGESTAIANLHPLAVQLLQPYARTFVEFKGHAIALHYREMPDARAPLAAIASRLLREAGDGFELQAGNLVYEIKPRGTSKATAIEALMSEPPFAGRTPWVFGDDLTDEHAFHRVNALRGISVIVGERRPTAARHALDDPAALRRWLAALVSG